MRSNCPLEFITFAHSLAEAGGELIRRDFRGRVAVEVKTDGTPVTQVDREVEELLRELLEKEYPGHGIIGEEYPPVREDAEFVWLIDPIDGTSSFISGLPTFGSLIGLAWRGEFVLGLIDQPILRERWIGADGQGTSHNGQPVKTRSCASLRDAALYTLGPAKDENEVSRAVTRICRACRSARYCLECYTYGLLSMGYLDVAVSHDCGVYDFAPLEPVIRNAGGLLTDWRGNRLRFDSKDTILAIGDPRLLREATEHLMPQPPDDKTNGGATRRSVEDP